MLSCVKGGLRPPQTQNLYRGRIVGEAHPTFNYVQVLSYSAPYSLIPEKAPKITACHFPVLGTNGAKPRWGMGSSRLSHKTCEKSGYTIRNETKIAPDNTDDANEEVSGNDAGE